MSRLLDDLLDIKHNVKKYIEPVQEQVSSLMEDIDPSTSNKVKVTVLKQAPRVNKSYCARTQGGDGVCGVCQSLCPVDAIELGPWGPTVSEACIGCGICSALCPTESLSSMAHTSFDIFDKVGRNSALYTKSYITCEKAELKHTYPNVYTLSCLGAISKAQWSFIMNAYDNVALYIPEGLCDGCEVSCGESLYRAQIYEAEKSGMYPLSLVRDEADIESRLHPHLEREELAVSVSKNHLQTTQRNEVLESIEIQKRAFKNIETHVFDAYGSSNAQKHQRRLTDSRRFDLLSALYNEEGAKHNAHKLPRVNPQLCSGCAKCSNACPTGACEVDRRGVFHVVDALCVGCGACVGVCDESALSIICKHF